MEQKNKILFIEEVKDFFTRYKLPFEHRNNLDEKCIFISKETETILYYNSNLDLSININFENSIVFKVEHYNSFNAYLKYDMQVLKCKLFMLLDYIESHKRLKHLENQLKTEKIHPKWKSKNILDKLSFVGQMESIDEEEYN